MKDEFKIDGKSIEPHEPRILVYDIETSPSMAYVWRFYDECISPDQVIDDGQMLCFAAKWLGHSAIYSDSKEKDKSDRRICRELWKLFDEADVVVAHNGQAFDQKTMNSRWVHYGMPPPSAYKVVDTLKMARSMFRFGINKLDYIARYLNQGRKMKHHGFKMWVECMNGDPDAWETMRKYNIQDVRLLEGVYLTMRSWDPRHPNVGLMYKDNELRCVCCGSDKVIHVSKHSFTNKSIWGVYRCRKCGKVMRSGKAIKMPNAVLSN